MDKHIIKISAWEFNPDDGAITADLIGFLQEIFKTESIIILQENEKEYTVEMIEELANDILTIREAAK